MVNSTGRIIKSNDVTIEGSFQLGSSNSNNIPTENNNPGVCETQAQIVENNENYVVIQVECSCGKKISLRGDYIGS